MSEELLPARWQTSVLVPTLPEPTSNTLSPRFPQQDCEDHDSCPALDVKMNLGSEGSLTMTKGSARWCYESCEELFLLFLQYIGLNRTFQSGKGPFSPNGLINT